MTTTRRPFSIAHLRGLTLITVACVAVSLTALPATAHAAPEFGGGLRLGPVFSQMAGDDAGSSEARLGLAVHAVGEIITHPFFAVQFEMGYVERGETRRFDFLGEEQRVDTRLRYLDIPVMARLQIPAIVVAPYIEAGPYVSFLLDADTMAGGESREVYDAMNSVDYGLAAGAGLIVDAKVLSVMLGARFTRGFAPVVDGGSVLGFEREDPEVYNQAFTIHAGLGF